MTTQQVTTSPGGYEAHDQRKRERLRAPHGPSWPWGENNDFLRRRQTNERLREEMHAQGWAAGSFADSVRMDWSEPMAGTWDYGRDRAPDDRASVHLASTHVLDGVAALYGVSRQFKYGILEDDASLRKRTLQAMP